MRKEYKPSPKELNKKSQNKTEKENPSTVLQEEEEKEEEARDTSALPLASCTSYRPIN